MYKVGDMVRIRDLPVGVGNDPLYPYLWYNSAMKKMAGQIYRIGSVCGSRYILLGDSACWQWTDAFLIPAGQRTE